jgi:hypothetical protein
MRAEQFSFSEWINAVVRQTIPPDEDKILYEIGKRFGIQAFIIRVLYALWNCDIALRRRDRNPISILEDAETR